MAKILVQFNETGSRTDSVGNIINRMVSFYDPTPSSPRLGQKFVFISEDGTTEVDYVSQQYIADETVTTDGFAGQIGVQVSFTSSTDVKSVLEDLNTAISQIPVNFLTLDDTPSSYSGQAGKVVIVTSTEDGLEFSDSSDNIYTLVTTPAEYQSALTDNAVTNIWMQGVTFSSNIGFVVDETKNIFGGTSADFIVEGTSTLTYNFPVSTTGNEVFVNHFIPMNNASTTSIVVLGGFTDCGYTLNYTSVTNSTFTPSTDVKINYELYLNDSDVIPLTDARLILWSNLHGVGKLNAFTSVSPAPETNPATGLDQRAAHHVGNNNYEIRTQIPISPTTGVEIGSILWDSNTQEIAKISVVEKDAGSDVLSSISLKVEENDSFVINEHDFVGIGVIPEDWKDAFSGMDIGDWGGIHVEPPDTGEGGITITHNAWKDNTNIWRYKNSTAAARIVLDGSLFTIFNAIEGVADGTITWITQFEIDPNGNFAYNGATIPSDLNTAYQHEFRSKSVHMYNKTNEITFESTNVYRKSDGNWYFFDDDNTRGATIFIHGNGVTTEINVPDGTTSAGFAHVDFETKKIDADGNIAFNGATIPSDAHESFFGVFKFRSCVQTSKTNDNSFECTNCYRVETGGKFSQQDNSSGSTIIEMNNGVRIEYNIPSGETSDFDRGDFETKRTDINGNIAHNGGTIPSGLSSNFVYEFWPESCLMKSLASGAVYQCVNVYNDGVLWKSMVNSGTTCTFTALGTVIFQIRKSDANATSVGQTMNMTVVVTPS